MGKRKLSKQQKIRIAENRAAVADGSDAGTANGELLAGLVVSHYGGEVEILELETIDGAPAIDKQAISAGQDKNNAPSNTVRCHFRANLPTLVCGDHVYWRRSTSIEATEQPVLAGETGVVESIAERHSLLSRPRPYEDPKPVAANIDQVYIIIAPQPEPFTTLIDRYLIAAENAGLQAALVINKIDLLAANSERSQQLVEIEDLYQALGYPVFRFSAEGEGEWQQHNEVFKADCAGKRSILVGQSGVGKSSMINALCDSSQAQTGDISSANEKGRHTTTTSQLYFLTAGHGQNLSGAGQIIDSPGIREFGLWHLSENDIINGLPEFRQFATQCRFRDCEHGRSKGCEVQAAIERGDIHASRSSSYQQILASLK